MSPLNPHPIISDSEPDAALDRAWQLSVTRPEESEALIASIDASDPRTADIIAVVRGRRAFRRDPAGALPSVEAAAATLEDDPVWGPRTLMTLGKLRFGSADDRGAIEVFERALRLDSIASSPAAQAEILFDMAYCSHRLGELTTAAEYCTRAKEHFEQAGNEQGVARAFMMLGSVFRDLDDQVEALRCYERSLEIVGGPERTEEHPLAAKARLSIGQTHRDMGNPAQALEHIRAALASFERVEDLHSQSLAHMEISTVLRTLGDPAGALDHLESALRSSQAVGDPHVEAVINANLGAVLEDLERHDDAVTALEAARDALAGIGALPHLREVYRPLAGLYERRGDLELAMHHLNEHVRLSEELGKAEARKRVHAIAAARQIALAENAAEIERLRNVELAEALDQLKQAQAQLVHAEKMASLGVLTAGIAHEINNPVNFIRASTSPLRRDLDAMRAAIDSVVEAAPEEFASEARRILALHDLDELRDEVDSLLRGIEEGAARTGEIVRSLRTFSRLDEDELKPVDLHEGIEATLTLLHPRLGDLSIVRQYGKLPEITCYPGQINQVFMSVLANAIDASGDAGAITITTSREDGYAVVAIGDTGVGISPEHLSRIFEPFFTTKEVGSGQGLGLSIAHSIVERHGGSLAIESEQGVGTTVTMRLPVVAGA
jgi:signal transduction histidine kinase